MKFKYYIKNNFRGDLTKFFSKVSDDSKIYKVRGTDQSCILIKDFSLNHLNFVTFNSILIFSQNDVSSRDLRSYKISNDTLSKSVFDFKNNIEYQYFSLSLYFTVLLDQFCFTYFRYNYFIFRMLTNYPKYINRSGINYYHESPEEILKLLDISLDEINKDEIREILKKEFFQIFNNLESNHKKLITFYKNDLSLRLYNLDEDLNIKTENLWRKFDTRFMKKNKNFK